MKQAVYVAGAILCWSVLAVVIVWIVYLWMITQ